MLLKQIPNLRNIFLLRFLPVFDTCSVFVSNLSFSCCSNSTRPRTFMFINSVLIIDFHLKIVRSLIRKALVDCSALHGVTLFYFCKRCEIGSTNGVDVYQHYMREPCRSGPAIKVTVRGYGSIDRFRDENGDSC